MGIGSSWVDERDAVHGVERDYNYPLWFGDEEIIIVNTSLLLRHSSARDVLLISK